MNNCTAKLSGHLKVWLARAVTEKGTHDSAGTRHEYRLCLAVQKMSQKETTRAITSSSDKLHQTEREEMNEELLNGSFQLLILQLKPGAGFFSPSRYSQLFCHREAESGIPSTHRCHLGISVLVTIHLPVPHMSASTRSPRQPLEPQKGTGPCVLGIPSSGDQPH